MRIYFSGSIRGAEADKELYKRIIGHLSQYGKVLTEHSFDYPLSEEILIDDAEIYDCDMSWLRGADLLVAEVSNPSLGVGYEIGKAEDLGKSVLCLYRERDGRRLSAMIGGNPGLTIVNYDDTDEALKAIDRYMKSVLG